MKSPHYPRHSNALLAGISALMLFPPVTGRSATLNLAPNAGFGMSNEAVKITGGGFPPNSTLNLSIGGVQTSPATVQTNNAGALIESFVLISKSLPSGKHGVTLSGAKDFSFPSIYTVRRSMTIDPPFGDGRAGKTWKITKSIPVGGSSGMVFTVAGTGFPSGLFVPADSIKIGRASTIHEPLRIGTDGVLPATTIIVGSDLPPGRYDLSFKEGASTVSFSAIYQVSPWAATEALRASAAARSIEAARPEIKKVITAGGDLLPPEVVTALNDDLKKALEEVKAGNFETAEDLARGVADKSAVLIEQANDLRKDKMKGLAEVIASGFDTIQPEGAPAARQGAALVEKGRKKLTEAATFIEAGNFDKGKSALKEANEILKKARDEAGVKSTEEPIRW